LLADEPTGNLDRVTAHGVAALLNDIRRELGTTIVVVTHDDEIVAGVADRVVCLRDGRLIEAAEAAR
jgi:ABC-type lipoprotein export system ATPase subunit